MTPPDELRRPTAEQRRLTDSQRRFDDWKNWGPYVSDRAWGTVREDYSSDGNAWTYFPFEQARSRAFRWNEDGLAGFCNRFQNLCLAVALWNERDPILKERLFGLSNPQGNHGEDVKEYYFHLDSTPTHSYGRMLYRYPQVAFPYRQLVEENARRGKREPEYELIDALSDTFAERRFFDVTIEYAKAAPDDILCRITALNRGPAAAPLHVLPHVWFRNTWRWGHNPAQPLLEAVNAATIRAAHRHLGQRWWYVAAPSAAAPPELLFCENETNNVLLFHSPNQAAYVKDGIDEAVVRGRTECVNPAFRGTKAAAHARFLLNAEESATVRVRFSDCAIDRPFADFEAIFAQRRDEADDFYAAVQTNVEDADERALERQAFAGLLWNKQFYHLSTELWLDGDPGQPPPPSQRASGPNAQWRHLYNLDVLSMPDKWEYPWYAAWDLAFHVVPIARIDPEWAKRQLVLLLREWFMHPNGQIPAYEWNFSDVNPPVHAWAAWQVYSIARQVTGAPDVTFLAEAFQKLLLNFTWWVNRKDSAGKNIFQGGFLGLDNIGVFDRSHLDGAQLEQADSTGWMGMYCLNMLSIAMELARHDRAYEGMATKFFEHFIYIADAINSSCGQTGLWNEEDGFYYDLVQCHAGALQPLRTRSFVGLIPLFAVETFEPEMLERLPRFRRRMEWFLRYRPHLVDDISSLTEPGRDGRRLLAIVNRGRLERILQRMLDPEQFLSPFGLRSLSREHLERPYQLEIDGQHHTVSYEPAESQSGLFGGNSNWRGPVWFPLNYLMIESLRKYHRYYGDTWTARFPASADAAATPAAPAPSDAVAAGRKAGAMGPRDAKQRAQGERTLDEIADELSRRLIAIFKRIDGRRAVLGGVDRFQNDPLWRDYVPFYEYFHGDNGAGLGASHQTGWTALVATLIDQLAAHSSPSKE